LARGAKVEDHYDGAIAVPIIRFTSPSRLGLPRRQKIRQREPDSSQSSDLQKVATANPIAGVSGPPTSEVEHDDSRERVTRGELGERAHDSTDLA
jgi:hypothetical protein